MSCIALEQLPLVAKSKWISPDIVLASLCFYVRDEKHITKNDLKETVSTYCKNLNEDLGKKVLQTHTAIVFLSAASKLF